MNWKYMTADNSSDANKADADNPDADNISADNTSAADNPDATTTDATTTDATTTETAEVGNSATDASAEVEDGQGLAPAPEQKAPRTKSARAAARQSGAARSGGGDGGAEVAEGTTGADEASGTPSAQQRRGSREVSVTISAAGLLKILAGVVVVALIVGVALLGWGYYRDQQKLSAFDDAKSASSVFTVKLVSTMNSDAVGDMKTLLGPLSTGEFRKNLEREQTDGSKALRDLNVKATPTVKSVSVESFDTDRASTAVLVEVTGTSTIAPSGGKELMLVWLDLVKEDGSWKVSKLSGAQAGLGQQQGTGGPAADTQGGSESPAPAAPSPAAPSPAAPTPAPGG
ncbi:hypothetical protein [Gordonia aichiensis]